MSDQIELLSKTIDILQSAMDGMDPSPIMIVGDMNVSLPNTAELSRYWYRQHPYNKHSFLLYDFLRSNDLKVANFNCKQDVSHAYFSTTSHSYIDHVFTSSHATGAIKSCSIVSNSASNVSDHYPLHTVIQLSIIDQAVPETNSYNELNFPRVNWSDSQVCSLYGQHITNGADSLSNVNYDNVKSLDEASIVVDSMCNAMVTVMHESSTKAISGKMSSYQGRFKANSWWTNDCLITRDKQRFWFGIWRSCGRPRQGQVYLCYKSAKKLYRSACKQAMNCNLNRVSHQLNNMYKGRNNSIQL